MTDRSIQPSEDPGDVVKTANRFVQDLDNDVDRAVSRVGSFYSQTLVVLDDALLDLEGMIDARRKAGLDVPVSWVVKQQRYQDLMVQVTAQTNRYTQWLGDELDMDVQNAVRRGEANALALLDEFLPGYQAQYAQFNRLPDGAVKEFLGASQSYRYMDGTSSPLSALFDSYGPDARKTVEDSIGQGIALGMHPNDVTALIRKNLGDAMIPRGATVVRTEMFRAYREANRRTYQENDYVVPTWIWNAHIGEYTCAACYAMHGQEFPVDTAMGSHPNCRCTMIPKTKSWAELGFPDVPETSPRIPKGTDLFDGLPESQQRRILGPKKFEAYKNGEIGLQDVVATRRSGRWGTTRSVASLDTARANAAVRRANERSLAVAREQRAVRGPGWKQRVAAIKERAIARGGMTLTDYQAVGKEIRGSLKSKLPRDYERKVKKLQALNVENRKLNTEYKDYVQRTYPGITPNYGDPVIQRLSKRSEKLHAQRQALRADLQLSAEARKAQKRRDELHALRLQANDEYEALWRSRPALGSPEREIFNKRIAELEALEERYVREMRELRKVATNPFDLNAAVTPRLRQLRSMGTGGTRHDYEPYIFDGARGNRGRDLGATRAFEEAIDYYPTDWVRASAQKGRVIPGKSDRGYYYGEAPSGVAEIVTSGDTLETSVMTMTHEIGHRMEDVFPVIRKAEADFYARRTAGEPLEHLGPGYGPNEVTRRDDFLSPYMGKDYGDTYYELVSMGFEQVLTPSQYNYRRLEMLEDLDYLDFILGLLGSV